MKRSIFRNLFCLLSLCAILLCGCGKDVTETGPTGSTVSEVETPILTTAPTSPSVFTEDPYVLTAERDPDQICLRFQPTGMVTEGEDCRYYIPADQELWLAEYEAALTTADLTAHREPSDSSSGIWLRYQDDWWELLANGDLLRIGSGRILAEDAAALRALCMEAISNLNLPGPVRPSQIKNIRSATLDWNGSHTITNPRKLEKLENWLSHSEELHGGAQCWFTALLTLTLQNGEEHVIAMATDSCCSWMSEGVFYDYGSFDNAAFFALFTEDTAPSETQPQAGTPFTPDADAFVPVTNYLAAHQLELAYAGEANFTGQRIYDFTEAYLRYGTVQKLVSACKELAGQGLSLKIWDAYRPLSAQAKLWEAFPDPAYVSPPYSGNRAHCRGSAVDVTLIDANGEELEMPSGFDDFSSLGDRDYSDCSPAAAANARLLQEVMEKHGFQGYDGEWWHFTDTDSYPIEEQFQPLFPSVWYADCREYITLRTRPSTSAEALLRIPANAQFMQLAVCGDFAYVSYDSTFGYVLRSYIQPA